VVARGVYTALPEGVGGAVALGDWEGSVLGVREALGDWEGSVLGVREADGEALAGVGDNEGREDDALGEAGTELAGAVDGAGGGEASLLPNDETYELECVTAPCRVLCVAASVT
jgi:hypothetical protein